MPSDRVLLKPGSITALVLSGGRGTRMGSVDKGLQTLNGVPLALHALRRLQSNASPLIASMAINANRHLDEYAQWGYPVWPDTLPEQPGPLAGILSGLRHCSSSHLLVVPCDAPKFPLDLAERLAEAFEQPGIAIAMASAPDAHGTLRKQPVFALMRATLADRLAAFLGNGGRKVGHWMGEQHTVEVAFDRPNDDPTAFENINTMDNLHAIESLIDQSNTG